MKKPDPILAFLLMSLSLPAPPRVWAAAHPSKCFKKGDSFQAQTLDLGGPPGSGPADPHAIPCCSGLQERNTKEYCGSTLAGGKAEMICISCGDGRCEIAYENNCNCPEDCKKR